MLQAHRTEVPFWSIGRIASGSRRYVARKAGEMIDVPVNCKRPAHLLPFDRVLYGWASQVVCDSPRLGQSIVALNGRVRDREQTIGPDRQAVDDGDLFRPRRRLPSERRPMHGLQVWFWPERNSPGDAAFRGSFPGRYH